MIVAHHPTEREDAENISIFDRAFFLVSDNVVKRLLLWDKVFEYKFRRSKGEADTKNSKIWCPVKVDLLGDKGPQLHPKGYQ